MVDITQSQRYVKQSLVEVLHAAYLRTQPPAEHGVVDFVRFCEDYLKTNRPVELFHADQNYGLRLSNNQLCLVAPVADNAVTGDMQPNTVIKI